MIVQLAELKRINFVPQLKANVIHLDINDVKGIIVGIVHLIVITSTIQAFKNNIVVLNGRYTDVIDIF